MTDDEFVVDLDAARAARREANGKVPTVLFGGVSLTLPIEMPVGVALCLADVEQARDTAAVGRAIMETIRLLLGEQMETFLEQNPSMADLEELFEGMMKVYGLEPGEPQASEPSSEITSGP